MLNEKRCPVNQYQSWRIINLKALYKAIKDEKIAGVALDVLEKGPPH